eukprot:CAMPEP_0171964742 /NCGR_PEP_ID=MMETSP0993-20121228/182974_1 /TAXON_ID=483369 /ORGANISM="non described non described, Strain CCMP2098" /LENGTH=51 /DNA_ID=CAMNT_0012613645 /DNA_START=403 /DNA_END=555 /DNA_ORIENTATION=-
MKQVKVVTLQKGVHFETKSQMLALQRQVEPSVLRPVAQLRSLLALQQQVGP